MDIEITAIIAPLVGRIIMTVLTVGALAFVAHAAAMFMGSSPRR